MEHNSPKTHDEISRRVEENRELMLLSNEVIKDIYAAEQAMALWLWIADRADQINASGFGLIFGVIQQMALSDMIITIGRVFSEENHENQKCIRRVLLKLPFYNLISRDVFIAYFAPNARREAKLKELPDTTLLARGVELISRTRPTKNNCDRLQRVIHIRDNEIAHRSEAPPISENRATFDDCEFCLKWARQFLSMVGDGFGNWSFVDAVASPVASLSRLCKAAGIPLEK